MNERTNDDSETGQQRQEENLSQQGVSNTISESNKRQHTNTIRYFSMFTGVGGFELGLETANDLSETTRNKHGWDEDYRWNVKPVGLASKQFTCVGMSEINKYSNQVLKYRFPNIKNWGDCTKINPNELPDFDMLCGGFPCQAFSIAGKRKGFEDTRGTLFFEIARILKIKRPKIVLLENVKGLLNHDKGKTFRIILQTLDELGYEVQWMVLNSKFFGVPQNRERVFIIGNLRGERRPEILPFRFNVPQTPIKNKGQGILLSATTGARRVKQSNCLDTMYHKGLGSKQERPAVAVLTPDRINKRQNGRRFKEVGEPTFTVTGQDIHGVAELKYVGAIMSDKNKQWLEDGKEFSRNFPQGQRVYDTEGISSTLAGNAGGLGGKTGLYQQGIKIRRLTPIECCRLQGFPDDWNEYGIDEKGNKVKMSDTQRYKQMGNAVTTNVITAVGSQILNKESQDG